MKKIIILVLILMPVLCFASPELLHRTITATKESISISQVKEDLQKQIDLLTERVEKLEKGK
jgi:hypothetical protein